MRRRRLGGEEGLGGGERRGGEGGKKGRGGEGEGGGIEGGGVNVLLMYYHKTCFVRPYDHTSYIMPIVYMTVKTAKVRPTYFTVW